MSRFRSLAYTGLGTVGYWGLRNFGSSFGSRSGHKLADKLYGHMPSTSRYYVPTRRSSGYRRPMGLYRAGIGRRMRTIKRSRRTRAKRAQSRKRQWLGFPVGKANCKTAEYRFGLSGTPENCAERELNQLAGNADSVNANPLSLTKGDGINNRERDVVDYRGFKIEGFFRQEQPATATAESLYVHIAVVTCKNLNVNANAFPTADFFRAHGSTRSQFFPQGAGAGASGLECNTLPINTDLYVVHRHKIFKFPPWESTDISQTRKFEMYIPIKRQIRYDSATAAPESDNVRIVVWTAFNSSQPSTSNASNCKWGMKVIKYFREPNCCY